MNIPGNTPVTPNTYGILIVQAPIPSPHRFRTADHKDPFFNPHEHILPPESPIFTSNIIKYDK